MEKLTRKDIHILAQHSNWSEKSIDKALQEAVQPSKKNWHQFISILFIGLGASLFAFGVLFFFAYNWADLHKFVKIGLIESLLVILILLVWKSKLNELVKSILLTSASLLIGVLFAVFGQIYQTGANAYDFFLGWTLAISIWSLVSNFAPLWLLFIALVNTTFILYAVQIGAPWWKMNLFTVVFILNALFTIKLILLSKFSAGTNVPTWLIKLVAVASVYAGTSAMLMVIFTFNRPEQGRLIILFPLLVLYGLGAVHGWMAKNVFLLAILALSVIILIASVIVRESHETGGFLLAGIFILLSVSGAIVGLQKFLKQDNHEQ